MLHELVVNNFGPFGVQGHQFLPGNTSPFHLDSGMQRLAHG